jgi:hypothetical protein
MIKVRFIKELNSGDPIVLPGRAREPLRFSLAMVNRLAEALDPEPVSGKVLRALISLRKRRGGN